MRRGKEKKERKKRKKRNREKTKRKEEGGGKEGKKRIFNQNAFFTGTFSSFVLCILFETEPTLSFFSLPFWLLILNKPLFFYDDWLFFFGGLFCLKRMAVGSGSIRELTVLIVHR